MSSTVSASFEAVLRTQGTSLTHDDLLREFPLSKPLTDAQQCLPSLQQCKFFEDFAISPDAANRILYERRAQAKAQHGSTFMDQIWFSNKHHELKRERRFDFRLTPQETEKLTQNGFVVSERLAADSFAEQYYRLYSDDMPVYVTSDSVLHAWHRSFDAFLVHLEEEGLYPLLETILEKARSACNELRESDNELLADALRDVDVYLAVAQALLTGEVGATVQPGDLQTQLVETLAKHQLSYVELFSSGLRQVDFSLFRPRGHYTKTELLSRFFKAMTWLGTIDFRVDGTENPDSDLRQLQRACVLVHVMREAQVMASVDAIQKAISTLTGDGFGADSMTPQQLHELLGDRDIIATYCCGPQSEAALRALQDEIANRGLGAQAITGHPLTESLEAAASSSIRTRLPTSFAFFGQQFVWSAFLFSKIVYDQVLQDDAKVVRRMPSAVDAAFALFGNDVATGEIAKRMTASVKSSPDFVPFRDGAPFASNLLAVRRVIDEQLAKADPTTSSIALLWQLALRELSASSASDATVFQSETWKKRVMNTQIASFTQLRHDTILYAKQSYTMSTCCEYAAGFVDPYPGFWTKMQQLAERTAVVVDSVVELVPKKKTVESWYASGPPLDKKARDFFVSFANVMGKVKDIAVAQSLKQELSEEQDDFLKSVIEERHGSGGSRYLGWYPTLFYTKREDSGKKDHLVADVHTDTPSVEHGDPGGILHLGVGDVNLGFFVVDGIMYAGPVFSSYELVTPINERLTDDEFSKRVKGMEAPLWARESFLVSTQKQ